MRPAGCLRNPLILNRQADPALTRLAVNRAVWVPDSGSDIDHTQAARGKGPRGLSSTSSLPPYVASSLRKEMTSPSNPLHAISPSLSNNCSGLTN